MADSSFGWWIEKLGGSVDKAGAIGYNIRKGKNAGEPVRAKRRPGSANEKFRQPFQRLQGFGDRVPKVLTLNLGGADSKGAR